MLGHLEVKGVDVSIDGLAALRAVNPVLAVAPPAKQLLVDGSWVGLLDLGGDERKNMTQSYGARAR
eukprot:scaffold510721_cov38-Prasinocladus_malaysianus.AAC.1